MRDDRAPIAHLTDHPVLSADAEAALVATMRAGADAQARAADAGAPDPALAAQLAAGNAARATLIRHNLRLVVKIARGYLPVAGDHLQLDDLISFGTIGLITAVDRFDPAKANKLSTYATWWIRQAISRGIADAGRTIRLPVHVHEQLSRQAVTVHALRQELGTEPAPHQVASALGWSMAKLQQMRDARADTRSLNLLVIEGEPDTELGNLIPDERYAPEPHVIDASLREDLIDAMRQLTEREQRFVRAYFGFTTGAPQTLEQIGAVEGLTRERVRQVIKTALQHLARDPVIQSYGVHFGRADDR